MRSRRSACESRCWGRYQTGPLAVEPRTCHSFLRHPDATKPPCCPNSNLTVPSLPSVPLRSPSFAPPQRISYLLLFPVGGKITQYRCGAMRLAVTRLIHSIQQSRLSSSSVLLKRGNAFSSDASSGSSKRVEDPFKIEETEIMNVTPPSPDKLLVLGGSGFVGSHICKEALDRGFVVSSFNRSGKPSVSESWADKVTWNKGNLLEPASLKDAMDGISAVVSCVGGFGSNSFMYKINGTANINAVRAAAERGVKRFVYVSAADFGMVNYLLQGYYEGKRAAEAELLSKFTYGGVILRPGFIHGTRRVGSVKIPLGLVGSPMQMVLQNSKPLTRLPLVGPLLTPPVSVTSVAKVAVRAATDPVFPPGIVDIYGIMRYSEQK